MAHPPGRATRAVPWRATRGPRTRTEARMVETSSYGARSLDTCATCTPSPPVWRDTVAPRVSRSLVMVRTSARSGAFASVRGSAVRSAAAIAGSAAFLAALTFTVPRSGTPPSISSRAGITPSRRRTGPRPRERRGRTEHLARGGGDPPDDPQPVAAAVQRQAGFVSANLRLEAGEDGARQV